MHIFMSETMKPKNQDKNVTKYYEKFFLFSTITNMYSKSYNNSKLPDVF
jgi:hypothetical protein